MVITIRDRSSRLIMGRFTSWSEVWQFQKGYLHSIKLEF